VFYLGKSNSDVKGYQGKGIQHRKIPTIFYYKTFEKNVGKFYKAFAYVIFKCQAVISHMLFMQFYAHLQL